MARKYELITELYQRTVAGLTAPPVWQSYLSTACRNFRLPFDEQILVFAQRPDATAVLTIEGKNGWNQRFGRWVNRGATGIAVFDGEHTGRSRLKHYFDISDTHEGRFSKPVPVWTMRPEFTSAVIETLENSFGDLEDTSDLASALLSAAKNAVEDNMTDYLTELHYYKEGSFLEELDDLNIQVQYRTALENSVGYMLLVRCGIEPSEYFTEDDFRGVVDFNTPDTLNALGVATGDIGQMCLSEISRTVYALQRQAEKQNRTFASQPQSGYPLSKKETIQPERSFEYERDHIHDAGRLQPAQPPVAPGAGGSPWEIRIDAPEVSEAAPARDLHEPADQRQAEPAPDGDRADSARPDGADHGADGAGGGRDGGTEGQRPDEMAGPDEQHPAGGGGDGAERTDLQLTPQESEPQAKDDWSAEGVPTVQLNDTDAENAESEELPAFLDDKLIMAVIANPDDDLKYKKQQIELYFSIHPDEAERADYLKSAYQDRYTEILVDGVRVGYKPQEDGLLMWEGAYLSRTSESVFSWGVVVQWTAQLIEKKEYFINTQITPPKSQDTQQLSLFDFAEFNTPSEPGEQLSFMPRPQLPQQIIDEALCIGANDENSRLMICAYFMKDKPLEDNAAFLQKHYGTNGAGFYVNDRQYAIWYDGDGIRVAGGDSAQGRSATLIPWEQAAKRIRELLDLGRYMPQSEINRAPEFEKARLADDLLYMYRDIDGDGKEVYFLSMKPAYDLPSGFPDMSAAVKKLLDQPDALQTLVDECRVFTDAYEKDRSILRFRYRPKELLQRLTDLQREPLTSTAANGFNPQRRFFISSDEIDKVLRGHQDYRLAVYSFYRNHPDRKEREKFLKDYHGEYSGYHGGNDNRTYTGKGLLFSHGSITEPYAKVELKWNAVEKRISAMIVSGRFISAEDRAAMPAYERHQLARDIQAFFSGVPQEQPRPYPHGFEYWDAVKVIETQLNDPARVEEIYQMMVPVWEATPQDDRMYAMRQRAFENLSAYRQGTFTLFAEKKEPVPPQTVQEPKKAYDLGFGYMGNGLTVWNRLEEVHGDYRTVAHIAPDRTVQIYDEEMPQEVRDKIQQIADTSEMTISATQDAPVFAVPPKKEPLQKEESASVLAAQAFRFYGEFEGSREAIGMGDTDEEILAVLETRLRDSVQRKAILAELQSYLDHIDPEKELAVDLELFIEQLQELPEELTAEQRKRQEIAEYLEEAGYVVSDELLDEGILAYPGRGDNQDIADFIEDEFLIEEPDIDPAAALEEAKQLINAYYLEEFGQEADYSDLRHVDLAFSSTSDSEHTVEVFADLAFFRLVYQVDGDTVREIACDTLEELNEYLSSLDFDTMVAEAEEQYQQKQADQHKTVEDKSDTLIVARYLSDGESIVIQRYPNGQYYNRYGYDEQNSNAASTAGGFATLEEAENTLLSHRPSAVKVTEAVKEPAEEKHSAALAPPKPRRERMVFTTLHPEIPADQRRNFRITDEELGYGTRSEKYAANVAAIRCLKQIEAEKRLATPEEQETLSRYVGWGGLADCFDERHGKYLELKSLLDEDEYAAARASSLTAFYTSPVIIRAMYQALSQMGFQEGNIRSRLAAWAILSVCSRRNFRAAKPTAWKLTASADGLRDSSTRIAA